MKRRFLQSYLPLVAGLLLAVYGAAGVLGYGLHSLWGCGHCHEGACHPSSAFVSTAACSGPNHDLRSFERASNRPTSEPTDPVQWTVAQEDCPICAFLVQAQSQFVYDVASECVDVVPTIPPAIVSFYVSPLLGTHPGRGPPIC